MEMGLRWEAILRLRRKDKMRGSLRQAQGRLFPFDRLRVRMTTVFLGRARVLLRAIETPLVFGGFSPETVERFGDKFRAMGLTPVAGLGGADPTAVQPEPLV